MTRHPLSLSIHNSPPDGAKQRTIFRQHILINTQALWNEPDLLEIPARTDDEHRSLMVGTNGKPHLHEMVDNLFHRFNMRTLGSFDDIQSLVDVALIIEMM